MNKIINVKLANFSGVTAILVVLSYAYWTTLQWMYVRYTGADSYYSHGFLIPFVFLFLIWQQREKLQELRQEYDIYGLFLIIFALMLHLLGTLLYVFSISGFSLFFLIVGLTLFLFGRQVTGTILFPLFFLLFMFPLPEAIIAAVSFPLKMFVANVSIWLVRLFNLPVYQEGFLITITNGTLMVGNPCSGLRSLIAFLAFGALLGYLKELSLTKKWILFALSIPVAFLSNLVRVIILILISYYWGLNAAAPDTLVHVGTGILLFVLGFIILLFGAKVLE